MEFFFVLEFFFVIICVFAFFYVLHRIDPFITTLFDSKSHSDTKEESTEPSEEYLSARSRGRGNRSGLAAEAEAPADDCFSTTTFLATYTSLVIERLVEFLVDEALKLGDRDEAVILSAKVLTSLRHAKLNDFKDNLRNLRACVFLVNNMDFVRKYLLQLNQSEFEKIQSAFEINSRLVKAISKNTCLHIDQACDIFRFLVHKWENISEGEPANAPRKQLDFSAKIRSNSLIQFDELATHISDR